MPKSAILTSFVEVDQDIGRADVAVNDRFRWAKASADRICLKYFRAVLISRVLASVEHLFQVGALDVFHDHDQDTVDDVDGQQLDDVRMIEQPGLQDRFLQKLVGLGGWCGGGSSAPAGISESCPRPGTRCRNRRCPISSRSCISRSALSVQSFFRMAATARAAVSVFRMASLIRQPANPPVAEPVSAPPR